MDLLLTHAYFIAEDAHEKQIMKPYPPLGILYLAAYLKARGFSIEVFDTTFATPAEFFAHLERTRPSLVGIYVNLMTKFNALAMIAACKRVGARVILGGPEPAPYAAEYLARGADVVVVGEGEAALAELLPALAQFGASWLADVAGIFYRDENGGIVQTAPRAQLKNLDALPFPDRAAINLPQYIETWRAHHRVGSASLICARGCPYHCAWCSHAVYGETHRRRSPQNVADEAEFLITNYQPDQFWYADDVFTIHHGWLFEYAAELKRRGIRLPFECITRADRVNDAVIDSLAAMGCARVWIGSESGSQKILDAMRREVRVEQVQWATRALKARGIEVGMFIMLGYEGEAWGDIRATVEHVKKCAPDILLSTVAYPIKSTAYYQLVEQRILTRGDWSEWTDRQLDVRGRHSREFYEHAQRWMFGEFNLQREMKNEKRDFARIGKAAANVARGKIGMQMNSAHVL